MTEQTAILNIAELARYLKVPKSTLYALVREGKIPSHRVGRHWRFRRECIDRWLDEPEQQTRRMAREQS